MIKQTKLKTLKAFSLGIFFVFLLISCSENDFDLSEIDLSDIKPEFKIPFVSGEIGLIDIVDNIDSTVLVDDETSILKVLFEDSNSISFETSNVISLDQLEYSGSQKLQTKKINLSNLNSLNTTITLDDLASNMPSLNFVNSLAENSSSVFPPINNNESGGIYSFSSYDNFKYVVIDSGFVQIEIKNNLSIPVDVNIEISDKENVFLVIQANNILPDQLYQINEDLNGKMIYNELNVEVTKFNTPGSGGTPVSISPSSDNIEVLFEIGEISVSEGEINISDINSIADNSLDVDLSFYDSVELTSIVFTEGQIDFEINSSLSFDVDISYSLPAKNGNDSISDVANINSNGVYNKNFNIKDYTFDLHNESINKYNNLKVNSSVDVSSNSNFIIYKSDEEIEISFTLSNLAFKEINGYFGNKTYDIDRSEIDLDKSLFDFYDRFDGEFLLTNPSFGLNIYSSMGVPISFNLDIEGSDNKSNSEKISLNSNINQAVSKDGSLTETKILIDKNNSNIVNFINLPPLEEIVIDGNLKVNPDGVTHNNFILENSEIYGNIFFELPFEISASNMTVSDTIQTSEINLVSSIYSAKMILNYETDIPVDFDISLIFLDQNLSEIDRSDGEISVSASDVDANGYSTGLISDSFTVDLSKNLLDRLSDIKNVIFEIKLNTDNSSSVNITSAIKFKFQSILEVKLNGI